MPSSCMVLFVLIWVSLASLSVFIASLLLLLPLLPCPFLNGVLIHFLDLSPAWHEASGS